MSALLAGVKNKNVLSAKIKLHGGCDSVTPISNRILGDAGEELLGPGLCMHKFAAAVCVS
jgi:hypothetical protein